ncbi:NAD(P)-binding domain-containing protein [Amnibacterium endophyticum]|uniref:NAD(P)-binding domain-containing protein n=1 Tax=Amnibacterium endophyticum TaxID=2109337 RepID=A0ABW4LJI1_9MICO
MDETLPVVVIGAGPQGLAAGAHLLERGLEPLALEAGDSPAAAVREWGHVRLFSDWSELVDAAAARLLGATGWSAPPSGHPLGSEWADQYLAPLAAALGDRVRTGTRVVGVSRLGRDRVVDAGRGEQPFVVHVQRADGSEERIRARAVLDASGSWAQPNPAGADGLPAIGERTAPSITYRVPDLRTEGGLAGRHVVVVGSGHSAMTAVNGLVRPGGSAPAARVTWVLRRGAVGASLGGGEADQLPARGAIGLHARRAVDSGAVELVTGFRIERFETDGGRTTVVAEDGRRIGDADRVIVLTGFRPDLSFLSEIRLDLDPTLQAPRRLAAEIDPNVHSCGTVRATGEADLAQPEPDFYLLGAKSYGRAPTFLAMTGYEQVRSVVAMLAGDGAAAERVELALPETGVCGGSGLLDADADLGTGSCCAPVQHVLQIGRRPVGV